MRPRLGVTAYQGESDDGEQEQEAQSKAQERERPICLHAIDLHDTTSVSVTMAHDNEGGRIVVPGILPGVKMAKILFYQSLRWLEL